MPPSIATSRITDENMTVPTDYQGREKISEFFGAHAAAVDRCESDIRPGIRMLGELGLLDLGVPDNAQGRLASMLRVVEDVASARPVRVTTTETTQPHGTPSSVASPCGSVATNRLSPGQHFPWSAFSGERFPGSVFPGEPHPLE